jgi:probable rRNA maturation factor
MKKRSKNTVDVFFLKKTVMPVDPAASVSKVLEMENVRGAQVNIIFAGDAYIREINLGYRLKNRETDVISFEYGKGSGDIYVSVERAKRDAKELGISLKDEYLRLLVHGALHITGYDHIKDSDYKKMKPREAEYVKLLSGKGRK